MREAQVKKEHYDFATYYFKGRWVSLWQQLCEVHQLGVARVLEVGPGLGVFKEMALRFGLEVETVDVAADLKPDHIGSVTEMPFAADTYDCVCAFQVLEHLPYGESLQALGELIRVSRKYVLMSLPDDRPYWKYEIHVPGVGPWTKLLPKPFFRPRAHIWNGEHYWELNKQGYSVEKVLADFTAAGLHVLRHYPLPELPRHHFFIGVNLAAEQDTVG